MCIVFQQLFNAITCKTRIISIFTHGMRCVRAVFELTTCRNHHMNIAFVISMAFCLLVVYTPFLNVAFASAPVHGWFWLTPLSGVIIMFVYNEVRKWYHRRCSHLRRPNALTGANSSSFAFSLLTE